MSKIFLWDLYRGIIVSDKALSMNPMFNCVRVLRPNGTILASASSPFLAAIQYCVQYFLHSPPGSLPLWPSIIEGKWDTKVRLISTNHWRYRAELFSRSSCAGVPISAMHFSTDAVLSYNTWKKPKTIYLPPAPVHPDQIFIQIRHHPLPHHREHYPQINTSPCMPFSRVVDPTHNFTPKHHIDQSLCRLYLLFQHLLSILHVVHRFPLFPSHTFNRILFPNPFASTICSFFALC